MWDEDSLLEIEDNARREGFRVIAGIDEAGRGPLAGPVSAAACILPAGLVLEGVDDSKRLTALQRERLFDTITQHPDIHYAIACVDAEIIDSINILQATIQAMLLSVDGLDISPDLLLVDGLALPHVSIPSRKYIKGDQRVQAIAAASVLAKVARDRVMLDYHDSWPVYGFDRHKGYGTQAHREAIAEHGPCPIHRRSFEPIKSMLMAGSSAQTDLSLV